MGSARPSARLLSGAVAASAVVAASALGAACADDGPATPAAAPDLQLVTVESQRCRQPNRFNGVGVVIGDGLVLTAGHTVEGDLRDLRVDDDPATVALLDRDADLAVLATSADVTGEMPVVADEVGDETTLLLPAGASRVTIDRHVILEIEHATDDATYRREVVVFAPPVAEGASGAPIVDGAGRLVGIVVLNAPVGAGRDESFAVAFDDVRRVLEEAAGVAALGFAERPEPCPSGRGGGTANTPPNDDDYLLQQ